MAKYENIRALAKKQLQTVTESSDRWKEFLRTAAIAYNYSFPNQLLIYAQNPTATAVADMDYWNKNAGRRVKRGAHGTAVFDTRANSPRLRYLFDISDTIPIHEISEALPWAVTDQNWKPVWDKIIVDNHADSIQSALLMISTSYVAQRSAMFTTALEKAVDGSSLQWAKPNEQRRRGLLCSRLAASHAKLTVLHGLKKSAIMVVSKRKPTTPRRLIMEYAMVNGYQIPKLTLDEPPMPEIGKYGSLRRKFLQENAPMVFDEMLLEGTLYPHLLEMDNAVHRQIEQTMQTRMQQRAAPNRQTDPMGWAQWMNAMQSQAEELAMQQIYSL